MELSALRQDEVRRLEAAGKLTPDEVTEGFHTRRSL
jgi:hypothetical protein